MVVVSLKEASEKEKDGWDILAGVVLKYLVCPDCIHILVISRVDSQFEVFYVKNIIENHSRAQSE
jgi:hypothetical protein